jgi:hypothetical protein
MPLFLTLRGATNALPITSAWVGLKPATTNPTWTTANHSQIVSRLHRVAYPGGSILTSRGGLILDSAEVSIGRRIRDVDERARRCFLRHLFLASLGVCNVLGQRRADHRPIVSFDRMSKRSTMHSPKHAQGDANARKHDKSLSVTGEHRRRQSARHLTVRCHRNSFLDDPS